MHDSSKPQVLAIGRPELKCLRVTTKPYREQWQTAMPENAGQELASGVHDIVIILAERPNCLEPATVLAWQNAAPLAGFVSLHTGHCEGEVRSGTPWPGVHRVYWHKWNFEYDSFLRQWNQKRTSQWHWPNTCTLVDSRVIDSPDSPCEPEMDLVVDTELQVDFESYAAPLRAAGCRVQRSIPTRSGHRPSSPAFATPQAIIINADSPGTATLKRIEALASRYPDCPIVLVLGFPDFDEYQAARRTGVNVILSRPLADRELFWALEKLSHAVKV